MTYKVTTTSPDIHNEQLRIEAARLVYEDLLRYINSMEDKSA